MSRMSEAQYELMQDCKDKKITARSARHTRTHCGKSGSVKFPSDYLSTKERKKLSGECKSYRMNDPMTWKEFKAMPVDLQSCYIKALRKKYNVPDNALCEMFGVAQATVSGYLRQIGLGLGKNGRVRTWDEKGFVDWCHGVKATEVAGYPTTKEEIKSIEKEHTPAAKEENQMIEDLLKPNDIWAAEPNRAVPRAGRMTFVGNAEDILRTIQDILKNERVRFTVDWHIVDETGVVNMDTENLARAATALNYAALNEKRKKALGTKG